GFLEFQQAANTGAWFGGICERTLAAPPDGANESSRERSFRAQTAYQTVIAAVMCGRGGEVVGAARKRVEGGLPDDYTTTMLTRALEHADLLAAIGGAPSQNLDRLLADP